MSETETKIRAEVERRRKELNALPWWRPLKRQEAGDRYKYALLIGALWEIRTGRTLAPASAPDDAEGKA